MPIERPQRVDHTYIQRLNGTPADIFPLLCPVREKDWVRGWEPARVISESGLAEFACVFTTSDELGESTWFVSLYDKERHRIEFVKFTPSHLIVFLSVKLSSDGSGATLAECRYQYTALSEAGRDFVSGFTSDSYTAFMRTWEGELNHYLETGAKADTDVAFD